MIASAIKYHKISIVFVLLSTFAYYYIAYFLERTEIVLLLSLYGIVFGCFLGLIRFNKERFLLLAGIAVFFRLIFLGSIPYLSQDFYRFIWDGRLLVEGWNPYLYLPKDLMTLETVPVAQAQELYDRMGSLSASNYTNYAPINQLCFAIAALFSGKSITGAVIVLRVLIILADIGTLIFGRKLLQRLQLPTHTIWLFILNPLIIIELTGNLHFESVMLFFLVWSLYWLHKGWWQLAAVIFAFSVSVKLIPLLFLPLFFQWFVYQKTVPTSQENNKFHRKGILKLIAFYGITLVTCALLFLPFISTAFIENYQQTLVLYFQSFEFNASIYYIARWIGYQIVGWNTIETIGTVTPMLVFIFVILLSLFRNNKTFQKTLTAMLFGLSFYFFMSTTVHPWYLTTLVLLCVFTRFRFMLVWSFLIVLSYTAYSNGSFQENYLLIAFEYVMVYGFLCWELFRKSSQISLKSTS